MLTLEGVGVRIDGRPVLAGVDLVVPAATTVAVLGPSGSGKTTLLRVVAGLVRPDDGRVTWNGDDLGSVPPHRRRFGLMFQEYALFWDRDVRGNVEFGLRAAGVPRAERRIRVDAALDRVGLAPLADRSVATLSGGERQRVALARSLVVEPRLLMLDEPLGALDREWRERLLGDLRSLLAARGIPALVVTHDQAEAFALADVIAVMREGRIVQAGPAAAVWAQPTDAWVAGFLGFGPAVTVSVAGGAAVTPWGPVPVPATVAGRAVVVPRPDAFRIEPGGTVVGVVERCEVVGGRAVVTVAIDGSAPVRCETEVGKAPEVGAPARLALDSAAVLVYPVG